MKNYFIKPVSAFVFSKKRYAAIFLFFATIFMLSCRKDINENFNGATITDSTAVSASAIGNTYYVATNGNDANAGTISSPFATWEKLSTVMVAGDIAYIRGGTYRSGKSAATDVQCRFSNLNGTVTDSIKIMAYPGEKPVLNLNDVLHTGSDVYGFYLQNSKYVSIKGLRITGLAQNPSGNVIYGFIIESSNNCKIELCEVDNIGGQGFFSFNSNDILYKNCDVHHLDDRYSSYAWNGSNGFSATGGGNTSTRNTYDGCRAWWISDDGWDFFGTDGFFTVKNCWSFWNGYQPGTFTAAGDGSGFKLGPTATNKSTTLLRVLTNNLSFENLSKGFDQNGGNCLYNVYNNISFHNGTTGFVWSYYPAIAQQFKNNISHNDATTYQGTEIAGDHNSWNGGVTLTNSDFMSISSTGLDGSRTADGSLPVISFLNLSASSDLINAGANVGLPYSGNAPDIGAFENGGSQSTNQAPAANAGTDKNITLPINSVLISGSGTDADGTIASYTWSFRSGPNTPVLAGASTTALTASNLIAGTYVLRLTVTDNAGLTGSDEVNVSVAAATVIIPPPVGNSINVSQSSSDGGYGYYIAQNFGTPGDDATNGTQSVLKIYENGVALNPAHSIHADIRNIGRGRFSHWGNELYLSASDNTNPKTNGRSYTYTITTAISNQAPVANAGVDKTITLPINNTSITGSGSDADGTIASYAWTFRSGPNTPNLSGTNTTTLVAGNLKAGTYVFRLTVTDNGGLTAYDEVNVVVKASTATAKTITVSKASSDGGFAYFVAQNFGTPGDNATNGTQSVLKIYENGVALNPAHSAHADIRNVGRGRFSHWGNTLYFSASDNTNPKTNGRTYTYTIQ